MEDGEKKYIRAPSDDDSMKNLEWDLVLNKRSWVQTRWNISMGVPLACHVGVFFCLCFRLFMYKQGFCEGFYNNNENPINLKMD